MQGATCSGAVLCIAACQAVKVEVQQGSCGLTAASCGMRRLRCSLLDAPLPVLLPLLTALLLRPQGQRCHRGFGQDVFENQAQRPRRAVMPGIRAKGH